jgi:hypothetical protein
MSIHFKISEKDAQEEAIVHLSEIADKMRILLEEEIEPDIRGEGRNFFDIVRDQIAVLRGRIQTLENGG